MASDGATDPICGKPVDPLRARAVGIFGGVTYYFCSADCKARFQDPRGAQAPKADVAAPPVERRKPEPPPQLVEKAVEKKVAPPPAGAPEVVAAPDADTLEEPQRDLDHAPKRRSSWTVVLLLFALGGAVLVFLLRRG